LPGLFAGWWIVLSPQILGIELRLLVKPLLLTMSVKSISHDDTLATASGFLFAAVHIHLLGRAVEAGATTATSRVALHFAVVATNFADNVVEGLVDVDSRLGGSFDELAVERSRKSLTLCSKIVD